MPTDTTPIANAQLGTNDAVADHSGAIENNSVNPTRFDAVKVAAVRLALRNGEFRINAEAIADAMIQKGHIPL